MKESMTSIVEKNKNYGFYAEMKKPAVIILAFSIVVVILLNLINAILLS